MGEPAADAYLRALARGDSNAAALRGTAIQQIVDRQLTRLNRYLQDTLRNSADTAGGTNPATGAPLRPDYQVVGTGKGPSPIIDITTAREARNFKKTQKYQPPQAKQRIRINVTYDN